MSDNIINDTNIRGGSSAVMLGGLTQDEALRKERENFKIISTLAEDFDCISYIEFQEFAKNDTVVRYRYSDEILSAVPGLGEETRFTILLDLLANYYVFPDDKDKFIAGTRRDVIIDRIKDGNVYFINFRTVNDNGRVFSQIKFSPDFHDGELVGFVTGIHQTDEEVSKVLEAQEYYDIITVLSSEYNAVYYCNEDTHDYSILFQQGFVKEELAQLKRLCPKYEDGFKYYIDTLVHPGDRERMANELSRVPTALQTCKSMRIEFRRLYGKRYLYTEMYIVKVGEAMDELHAFVAGFAENDAVYRSKIEYEKQLEYLVGERTAELESKNRELNKINEDIIELLGNVTEARDIESGEHIRRVKGITHILGEQVMADWPEYGITPEFVDLMTSASALHDIGKIMIPDSILRKPDKLSKREFETMKTHCVKGCEMLKLAPDGWSASYLSTSMDICHYHHERYDGNGYPEGLVGDEIPISAQIVAVADCFDALTSKRVYKEPVFIDTAFEMVINGECGVFSDKIMASFKTCKEKLFAHMEGIGNRFYSERFAGITAGSLTSVNILLVDDSEMNREMGKEVLQAEGASVTCAGDGNAALEIFSAAGPGFFDAILMDVFMPEVDGLRATESIRALDRPDAKTIPIIAFTSLTSQEDINRCLSAGMNSFITKPISIKSLNRVLNQCMQVHNPALDEAVKKIERDAVDRIDAQMKKTQFLTGIDAEYAFVCYLNGNNNDISGFRFDSEFEEIFNSIDPRLPNNKKFDMLFRTIVPQKDFFKFVESVDRQAMTNRLRKTNSYQVFVPAVISGEERLYKMKISIDEGRDGNYFISLQNVDDETKAEIRSKNLIKILSESYTEIDFLDLDEDTYVSYQSASGDTGATGPFTLTAVEYVERDVVPEDRQKMRIALDKNYIRKRLSTHKAYTEHFRSNKNGNPRYMELQMVNAREDSEARYVMLTLSDIDEMVRKEQESMELLRETQSQLEKAEYRANRDELTGLKNTTAYMDAVIRLTEGLKEDGSMQFAIVIFDINNLKTVNDTKGHAAGDEYIKNTSKLICDVFNNSPVYRIGGDEFLAILTGEDYLSRNQLMILFEQKVSAAEEIATVDDGLCSVASGIADYVPGEDEGIMDVVKRADMQMYKNKRKMKK